MRAGITPAGAGRSASSGTPHARSTRTSWTSRSSPGAREGHLSELFAEAGLREVDETPLEVEVEHPTFESWWEPYELGVGPAGDHVARLDPEQRDRRCASAAARCCPPRRSRSRCAPGRRAARASGRRTRRAARPSCTRRRRSGARRSPGRPRRASPDAEGDERREQRGTIGLAAARMHVGLDHARPDGVDADAVRRHLPREAEGERVDRPLRGGVVDVLAGRAEPRRRPRRRGRSTLRSHRGSSRGAARPRARRGARPSR